MKIDSINNKRGAPSSSPQTPHSKYRTQITANMLGYSFL
jgi:hypothetical protein